MSAMYCHFCNKRLDPMEFYLGIKGRCVCPSCVPLVRSVEQDRSQPSRHFFGEADFAVPGAPAAAKPPQNQLRPMFR